MRGTAWPCVAVIALVACGSDTHGTDASTDAPGDALDCPPPPIHCFCPTLTATCVNGTWQCFGVCAADAGPDAPEDAVGD